MTHSIAILLLPPRALFLCCAGVAIALFGAVDMDVIEVDDPPAISCVELLQ